jgi:hypothetical protein
MSVCHRIPKLDQTWWYMPVIPALRKLKKEDLQFEASLGYVARHHLKKKKI